MPGMRRIILRATPTIVHTAVTDLGGVIPIPDGYNWATIFFDYTNGDETNVVVAPSFWDILGGFGATWMTWAAVAGVYTPTICGLSLTTTGISSYTFDVRGQTLMKFSEFAIGGTPTGVLAATVILKGDEYTE